MKAVVVLALCCGSAYGQLAERVDAIANGVLAHPSAGISIAIARNGQPVFARGYGMANIEHSVPVTPETVFHIASISKNILAAAVLRLVDQGKLQLDDEVTQYVPEVPVQGRHVTVRQLLNHTSGIYSFTSLPGAMENERRDLTHEQILALIKDKPFDFEPGTRWRYDNSAFYIAGMVVERVTKQDYATYVREDLFKPLGMSTASLCDAQMVVPHLASGYEFRHGGFVHDLMSWALPWAAGALCMTANDLLTWQAALDSGRVLTPPSLALMRAPTTLADGTKIDYGLGTRLGSLDGHRILGHSGGGGGFRSFLMSFPDDHLTIVVLTNLGNGPTIPLVVAAQIARAALGLPEKMLRDEPVPAEELAALTVTIDSDEGPVELFARDSKLHYRYPGTPTEGVLLRQARYVYALDRDTEIRFIVRDGRATWAMVYTDGMLLDPKYRMP